MQPDGVRDFRFNDKCEKEFFTSSCDDIAFAFFLS